ncbi:hypothetical protein BDZ89DRAFT_1032941 [Hymenopellis radicata]|nr:hypothetical protein BDZ89DRAFT_1032941 [Hymenopellis radicata]
MALRGYWELGIDVACFPSPMRALRRREVESGYINEGRPCRDSTHVREHTEVDFWTVLHAWTLAAREKDRELLTNTIVYYEDDRTMGPPFPFSKRLNERAAGPEPLLSIQRDCYENGRNGSLDLMSEKQ